MIIQQAPTKIISLLLLLIATGASAQQPDSSTLQFPTQGATPQLGIQAEGAGVRSEVGVAALMPWANRLWAVTYVSHGNRSGEAGVGLYSIDENMNMKKHPASITGTYANRMVHWPSNQAIIGPHFIDSTGRVRTVEELAQFRLAATMEHLTDREQMVYFLTMQGVVYEVDVQTLEPTRLTQLPGGHFKDAFTAHNRVFIASNSYEYKEPEQAAGQLITWDGADVSVIDHNPFNELGGIPDYGGTVFATGWDHRSAILRVFADGRWLRYRLPKASQTYDDGSNTEWMRIRQVESERLLMDAFGLFYEVPPFSFDERVWGIRPVSTHLHVIPDFVSWRGMLVMGSDLVEHDEDEADGEPYVGQPTAGLWFMKIDDLWDWGRPKGWGAVWLEDEVEAGATSDPFLINGFENKVVHLSHDSGKTVQFTIEVDFIGNGTWKTYKTVEVAPEGYVPFLFPPGFSAHWVRVTVDTKCQATAYFVYS